MNEPCVCGPRGSCPADCENRRKPARAKAVTAWAVIPSLGEIRLPWIFPSKANASWIKRTEYPGRDSGARIARVEIREIEE